MSGIKTSEALPPIGIFVLGYYVGGNHMCSSDSIGANMKVVRLLRNDNGMDTDLYFDTFGPSSYKLREIVEWWPLPDMKDE